MTTYKEQADKARKKGGGKRLTLEIHSWKEPGDTLVGKVKEVKPFTGGKFDTNVNQYILETDEGLISTVLGAATDKSFGDESVVGKTLFIEYRGKINLDDGRSVNKFVIDDISGV